MNVEDYLRRALRSQQPSERFTERVVSRIDQSTQPRRSLSARFTESLGLPRFGLIAAGLACVALLITVAAYRWASTGVPIVPGPAVSGAEPVDNREKPPASGAVGQLKPSIPEQQAGAVRPIRARRSNIEQEKAKQQLLLALHIASTKLNEAHRLMQDRLYERGAQ